jgi:hypothetical protein
MMKVFLEAPGWQVVRRRFNKTEFTDAFRSPTDFVLPTWVCKPCETVTSKSFGFGAAINCMLPLINVADVATYDDRSAYEMTTSGVTSESPGAGAFTPYTGRRFAATASIPAFAELYVSNACFGMFCKITPSSLKLTWPLESS